MNNLTIRLETEKDYAAVENLTREAFWNVYKPGADEHYYVHTMRSHPDFIPELAFVLEKDGRIVGNIMYTKAWLEDENGERKEILSFGPLCIAPEYQRQKLGKMLIESGSLLLLGPPGSGKTTLLRDLIRRISRKKMVSVVDERRELFPEGFMRDAGLPP